MDKDAVGVTPGLRTSFCGRFVFQKLLALAVIRLSVYLFKLYEDVATTSEYKKAGEVNFLLITAACLIVPPVFYAIFLIGSNLAKDDVLDKSEIGTKTVNGLLLIPWQIKRHLDLLHFAAQRVCEWRAPNGSEEEVVQTLKRNAEILEFFEDLYAGFLQIFLQLYLFFKTFSFDPNRPFDPLFCKLLTTLIQSLKYFSVKEPLIASCFCVLYFSVKEPLIASCFCVLSMLIAVRRRDDGPLTLLLSFLGWSSLIISRILVFSFAASHIRGFVFLFCAIHVIFFTVWVYKIAMESHQEPNGEEPNGEEPNGEEPNGEKPDGEERSNPWTNRRKRSSLALLVFLFFGIPSLVIWPIMFQLKDKRRPFIFLMIIAFENLFLLGVWFICEISDTTGKLSSTKAYIIATIVLTTLSGGFFLSMYTLCKPKYTDQVVLHDIRAEETTKFINLNGLSSRTWNATKYGIYYEFCDLVFKLPLDNKIAAGLAQIRTPQEHT